MHRGRNNRAGGEPYYVGAADQHSQFDSKKNTNLKKSLQNMKSVLQKAKDQAVGILGKSNDADAMNDMLRFKMDSQRLSLNAI